MIWLARFAVIFAQDIDNVLSSNALEVANRIRGLLGKEKRPINEDRLLMFIEPEKEGIQEVQYFVNGGTTYVQIYDNIEEKIVAGARVNGIDFNIKVVGENGSLGIEPTLLTPGKDKAASNIRELITKGELKNDGVLKETLSNYIENTVDKAKSVPIIGDLVEKKLRSPGN